MKVEKNLIEKVANGETILKGETVRIANYIIEKGLQSKFNQFAFYYHGNGNEIYDIQDCLLDFKSHGTEIVINGVPDRINPSGKLIVKSMTIENCLKKLFNTMTDYMQFIDMLNGKEFCIKHDRKLYRISYTALHYCFAKGRITEKQCLDMMRI